MQFERARSPENKQIRMNQIKEVAIDLLDTLPYHRISLSGIGRILDFDRTNLYKYVKSKEEIYLYVLMDELKDYVVDLEESFSKSNLTTEEEVAELLTRVLTRHRLYLKINALLYSIIEKNSNLKVLIEFNQCVEESYNRIKAVYSTFLPEKNDGEVERFMTYLHSFLIGAFPISEPDEKQLKAMEGLRIPNRFFQLEVELKRFIVIMINGYK